MSRCKACPGTPAPLPLCPGLAWSWEWGLSFIGGECNVDCDAFCGSVLIQINSTRAVASQSTTLARARLGPLESHTVIVRTSGKPEVRCLHVLAVSRKTW